jgi:hypothetical protein
MSDLPERDWKLLRELKPAALDRLCKRILLRATEVANTPGTTGHQRYLKLWELIQEQNEELARAFDDHRRSAAFIKIVQIHQLGLFTESEFARFSEETQKRISEFLR